MPADPATMSCPVCQGSFREVLREGILIDVCNQCRGVWLDRGELEKLLAMAREDRGEAPPERAQPYVPPQPQPQYREPPRSRRDDDDDDDRKRYGAGSHDQYGHKRKKKGFDFGDIFDFGD